MKKKYKNSKKITFIIIMTIIVIIIGLVVAKNVFKPMYYNNSRNGYVCSAGEYIQVTIFSTKCRSCTKGFYCPGNDQRYSCPNGLTTASEGKKSSSECNVCKDSKKWYNGVKCVSCTAPYYCKDGTRYLCEKGKTIKKNGSTSSRDCVKITCNKNEYIKDGVCKSCPKDHYCDGVNAISCGTNKTIKSGAQPTSSSACVCKSGYYLPSGGSICIICEQGKYCTNNKMNACSIGTYQDQRGQGTCKSCPNNKTTSKTGAKSASECNICKSGSYQSGGNCITCPAGSYCQNGKKIACPTGYTSVAGKSNKTDCYKSISGGYSIVSGKLYRCSKGSYSVSRNVYYGSDSRCTPCPKGTYQSGEAKSSCIKCPKGKTTATTGSRSISNCK